MKLLVLFISFLFAEIHGTYVHRTFLDRGRNRKYQMQWKFDDTDITVKLKVATTGWIAWGLSPKGKVEAADFVIGWLDNKTKHWHDMHGKLSKPTVDKTNDYKLISMSEVNGSLTVEFSRKLDLCSGEDTSISSDTMRVVFAWGDKDPANVKSIKAPTRGHYGTKSVYLLDPNSGGEKPTSVETFDLKMTNTTVEAVETSAQCRLFKLPSMSEKHHLIRIEQKVTIANEDLISYMILYQCGNLSTSYLNKVENCSNADFISECKSTPLHAWTDGGAPFNFPENVGLSLGTKNDSEFMLLEIHYENPDLTKNVSDSSGFQIYYTKGKGIRKWDAGVLAAGIMDDEESMVIPPNEESFTNYGYCSSKCLSGIKKTGMFVFGSLLQANAHGKKIEVKLVRDSDGKEIERITQDRKFDFKRRFSRYFAKKNIKKVLPGHSINVECTYNTKDTNSTIINGVGSNDESCAVFLYYYPKIKTVKCVSRSRKYRTFAATKLKWKVDSKTGRFLKTATRFLNLRGKRVFEAFKSRDTWKKDLKSPEKRKEFQAAGKKESYDGKCYYAGVKNERVVEPRESITHKPVVDKVIKSCDQDIVVLTGASTSNSTDNGSSNKNNTNTDNKNNNNNNTGSVGRTLHEVMSVFSLSCVLLCASIWIN